MIAYLIRFILCSAILYGYYHFFLRNGRFHQYNRIYLVLIIVAGSCLPLLHFTFFFQNEITDYAALAAHKINQLSVVLPELVIANRAQKDPAGSFAEEIVYGFITLLLLTRIGIATIKVVRLKKGQTSKMINGIKVFETSHPNATFSLFNWLFWNHVVDPDSKKGQLLFDHETYHIRQRHSLDLLFIELIMAFAWFNPVLYFIRKELKIIHEFLADQYATKQISKQDYAQLLVLYAMGPGYYNQLTLPFANNQLKRRITMLTKNKGNTFLYLRKFMVIPLMAVAFLLFSFTYLEKPLSGLMTQSILTSNSSTPQPGASPTKTQVNKSVNEKAAIPVAGNTLQKKEIHTTAINSSAIPKTDLQLKMPEQIHPVIIPVLMGKDTVPAEIREEIFTKMEVPPKYDGDWPVFLRDNLDVTVPEKQKAPAGNYQALIQFVIDTKGAMSNVKVIRDPGYGMGAEAMRVIEASGKWIPGKQNKRDVKAYVQQPITFRITDK